jgi:hypothetical protein
MSSSISNDHISWNVSNMMFARVLDFACDVGRELANSADERAWVDDLTAKVAAFGTYSPDVSVNELFPASAQIEFWRRILGQLATRIYERRIGNQLEQSWQVGTIWAVVDMARVLDSSAQLIRQSGGAA